MNSYPNSKYGHLNPRCTLRIKRCYSLFVLCVILLSYHRTIFWSKALYEESIAEKFFETAYQPIISPLPIMTYGEIKSVPNFEAQVNTTYLGNAFDGFNLFVLEVRNRSNNDVFNRSLFIFDMKGNVILQHKIGLDAYLWDTSCEFVNSTTILSGDNSGSYLWNIENGVFEHHGFHGHHDYEYNPINNTFFTLKEYFVEIEEERYYFDRLVEYNSTGDIIWELDTRSFTSHEQWCPFKDKFGEHADITHSNSVFFDPEEDMVYLNLRNTNTFYKINHSTKEVLWALGEYGDFTLFDIRGNQKEHLFFHTHSVEKIGDNTFILFDNDLHNQTDVENKRSRLLEITINEDSMTANESWSWVGPPEYFSGGFGDADRLPNGNRIGTFGWARHPIRARLVEVNSTGQIVWEMNFPDNNDFEYLIYRMERIQLKPILSSPSDKVVRKEENLTISWGVWYNFRNKQRMNGTYRLYINNEEVDCKTFLFEQFWQQKNLTFNIDTNEIGVYNLTLEVSDEAGHNISDTVIVKVMDLLVERQGPTEVEFGQDSSHINWTGFTSNPVNVTVYCNNSLLFEINWTGSDINLNLTSLGLGNHSIMFFAHEDSQLVYEESFWVFIYPAEKPVFFSSPSNMYILWNSSVTLSWSFFDNTPSHWELYSNSILISSGFWKSKNYKLNWSLPSLDEGNYNLTLIIYDKAQNNTSITTWITITPPSPPIISKYPETEEIKWGESNITFSWEVHGGSFWQLWRNGTYLIGAPLHDNCIDTPPINWQVEKWRLGVYNLTLVVGDENGSTKNTIWVEVIFPSSDPYADSIVADSSMWFSYGENALGKPDNNFASIFLDYGNGFLTLDMGQNEEIFDDDGFDFEISAQGGNYSVYISSTHENSFVFLGTSNGTTQFDVQETNLDVVRFVKVEYLSGETVLLDAVVALNYNKSQNDTEHPVITSIEDYTIWDNESSTTLIWIVYDISPWNYTIFLNEENVIANPWNGSDIIYTLSSLESGTYNVTLLVYDLLDNYSIDTVIIEVIHASGTALEIGILLTISLVVVTVILGVFLRYKWKIQSN